MPLPIGFLSELHDRNDIVEVVGSYVSLKRKGRTHWGLCPFHNEKTPSFVVYPDTQSFYCFGCGAGGDVITFIKARENLDYIEAVRFLASRAGMSMPEDTDDGAFRLRKRVLEANKLAARFFFDKLNSDEGRAARAYLRRRELSDATIKRFGIGFAPEGWNELRDYMRAQGFRDDELISACLCGKSERSGGVYDFFRNRAMFPIIDIRGSVIAFSGRTLGDDTRKYVNTGDTPVFKKSRAMFAMNIAKNNDSRSLILCEGQMDVIALHQAGFTNAVAACGTALTDEQVRMMSRYADEVTLCYDGDAAGQKAAKRSIELFKQTNVLVRVVPIEGAKDPDEFIKKFGASAFSKLLEGSASSIEYELSRAKSRYDTASDTGRIEYLKEASGVLARASTPTERDLYAGRVADDVGVSKESLLLQVEQYRRRAASKEQKRQDANLARSVGERFGPSVGREQLGTASAQRRLIALLFSNPDLCAGIADQISPDDFVSKDEGRIYEILTRQIANDEFAGFYSVSAELESNQTAVLSGIIAQTNGLNFTTEDADFLVERILRSKNAMDADAVKTTDAAELMKRLNKKIKTTDEV